MHQTLTLIGFAAGGACLAFMAVIFVWVRASSKDLKRRCLEAEKRLAAANKNVAPAEIHHRAQEMVSNEEYDLGAWLEKLKIGLAVEAE